MLVRPALPNAVTKTAVDNKSKKDQTATEELDNPLEGMRPKAAEPKKEKESCPKLVERRKFLMT